MPVSIRVELDERAIARAQARLAKYEGRPFQERMKKAFQAGAQLLVGPMRKRAPVGPAKVGLYPHPGGLTKNTIRVRSRRPPPGYVVQYGIKPRAKHSHFASKGVRPHSLATRPDRLAKGASPYVVIGGRVIPTAGLWHGGQAPHPFIEDTIRQDEGRVIDFIARNVASEGITPIGGLRALTDLGAPSLSPGIEIGG